MNRNTVEYTRQVCFAHESNSTALIESVNDFSKKEKKRCWYSKKEMNTMKNRCIEDAERLESGDKPSSRRGLEGLTDKSREAMEASIYACIDAVLDEQEVQWEDDSDDYDRLAVISQEVSKPSVDEAILRAINDAKSARKIYRQDEQLLSFPALPIPSDDESDDDMESLSVDEKADSEDSDESVDAQDETRSAHVDIGACCKTKKNVHHRVGRTVPMETPSRSTMAKAA